ncbi:MAG: hypothetical protein KGL39_38240 [Patescibacteria group bacterium]|nr:hypothetical protein [Patescibacteria group bacterium]
MNNKAVREQVVTRAARRLAALALGLVQAALALLLVGVLLAALALVALRRRLGLTPSVMPKRRRGSPEKAGPASKPR